MEIQARLLEVYNTVDVSDRFRKREFIVEYAENPQYPEYLKFELVQDRCELLDQYNVGDELTVHFDLRGRRWTDPQGQVKYFNSLQAWRLASANSAPPGPAGGDDPPPFPTEPPEDLLDDDLSF